MGRDVHEKRRVNDEDDPNPAAKTPRTSAADWENRKGRSARIGAFYRHLERLYERTYLNSDPKA